MDQPSGAVGPGAIQVGTGGPAAASAGTDEPREQVGLTPSGVHAGVHAVEAANEAVPSEAPQPGPAASGSIPAAHQRRVWSTRQATSWRLFLVRFLSAALSVLLTVALVPGLSFTSWSWGQLAVIGLVFGLLNGLVKPLLQFLVLRYLFSSYGVVVVVINVIMLVLLAELMPGTLQSTGLLPVILGGFVLGIVGLLLDTMLGANPPVLDRDYKKRNGLQ